MFSAPYTDLVSDSENTDDERPDHDERGRFAPGHRRFGGRRKGQTISAELRRQADPEHIAAKLLQMIDDPRTNVRERLGAIALLLDRTEGKAVSRSIHFTGEHLLPPGWDALPPAQKQAALTDMRERALRGVPLLPGGTDDEDDHGEDT